MKIYECVGWVRYRPETADGVSMEILPMTLGESRQHGLMVAKTIAGSGDEKDYEKAADIMRDVFASRVREVQGVCIVRVNSDGYTTEQAIVNGDELFEYIPEDLRGEVYQAIIDGGEVAKRLEKKSD